MHVSLQIIIAALSVLGFYFCLKTVASLIFTSKQIAAAVIIESKAQLKDLDLLLEDASSALFATRKRRLAVAVKENVWTTCNEKEKTFAKEITDQFDAEIFLIRALDF